MSQVPTLHRVHLALDAKLACLRWLVLRRSLGRMRLYDAVSDLYWGLQGEWRRARAEEDAVHYLAAQRWRRTIPESEVTHD